MPQSLFTRSKALRFFWISTFISIILYAGSSWATVIVKETYLLKGIWPVRTSACRLKEPAGLAADQRGFVYVADTGNHRIQQFTLQGDFLNEWGSKGSGDGQFELPHGVSTDRSGFVYVVDTGNCRIQKFTSDGVFVSQWGSQGSGTGEFEQPQGVMVNGDDVYVADTGNYRVQQFTANGQYITQWGGSKRFKAPVGISRCHHRRAGRQCRRLQPAFGCYYR